MEELIKKLETYNIFNFVLPGIIFVYLLDKYVNIKINIEDIIQLSFVYYFVGLVISRIGSIIIYPILKKINFIKFSEYDKYIKASKKDLKIETLNTENNMYRTFISLFSILIIIKIVKTFIYNTELLYKFIPTIGLFILLILFLFSYRKQTMYINDRIEANIKNTKDDNK